MRNVKNRLFLAVFIPAFLLFSATTIITVHDLMGKPAEKVPAKEWLFLDVWTDGKHIYVWHIERGKNYPETIKLPYDRDTYKQLSQAKQDRAAGKPMIGRPPQKGGVKKDGNANESGPQAPFEMYHFKPQEGGYGKDPQ